MSVEQCQLDEGGNLTGWVTRCEGFASKTALPAVNLEATARKTLPGPTSPFSTSHTESPNWTDVCFLQMC